jgi:hypothetical protein
MSIRQSNSRTFLREAGLDDWFGVIPAVVEFRRFPGEPSEQLRKRPRLHPHPWIIRKHRVALGRLYVHYAATRKSDRTERVSTICGSPRAARVRAPARAAALLRRRSR